MSAASFVISFALVVRSSDVKKARKAKWPRPRGAKHDKRHGHSAKAKQLVAIKQSTSFG